MKGKRGFFFKRENGGGDLLNESLIKEPDVNLQAKLPLPPSSKKMNKSRLISL